MISIVGGFFLQFSISCSCKTFEKNGCVRSILIRQSRSKMSGNGARSLSRKHRFHQFMLKNFQLGSNEFSLDNFPYHALVKNVREKY